MERQGWKYGSNQSLAAGSGESCSEAQYGLIPPDVVCTAAVNHRKSRVIYSSER